jgi:predicted O-methyltransferase YrrM
MAAATRRTAMKLDARLEALRIPASVKPISDIPSPQVDLKCDDPLVALMASPEFNSANEYFFHNSVASRSLVTPQAQALLYCLIRNLRPDHVLEIGAFRAGTTEAICRGLHANDNGMLHSVDPFRGEHIKLVFKLWPPALLRRVQLYEMDSMAFYMEMANAAVHPDIVFVDGNHDYEFALYDIGAGARAIRPGGFIFIDNVSQVGPFFAARDFLAANPGWRELGSSVHDYNREKAFDRARTTISETDFIVLRAPATYLVADRPVNFGVEIWRHSSVAGIRLKFLPPRQPGKLIVQVVFRGFGTSLAETWAEATAELTPTMEELSIAFSEPPQIAGDFTTFRVEPWLIWRGDEPLQLTRPPEPY